MFRVRSFRNKNFRVSLISEALELSEKILGPGSVPRFEIHMYFLIDVQTTHEKREVRKVDTKHA